MRWLTRAALVFAALVGVLALGLGVLVGAYRGEYPMAPTIRRAGELKARAPSAAVAPSDRSVVLLVFDGIAPALARLAKTPSLDRIARDGAATLTMQPVFPTMSMPNHVSLSTGCYPERHGIVSNRFIDPARGLYAEKGDAVWLEGCEHLSEVLERQGVRVSNFGWIGTHRGAQLLMTHGGPYEDEPPPLDARMDQVIEALRRTGERSRFIAAYVDEPDHTVHFKGIEAPESVEMMERIDRAIGRVLAELDATGLWDRTALIVTTDHGLIPVTTHLNIGGILGRADIDALVTADGSIAHVYLTDPSTRSAALEKLRAFKQLDVLVPGQAPAWARLGTSKRLGDLVISAKPGYYMFDRGIWPWHLRFASVFAPDELDERTIVAGHGYPPDTPGIAAVLYAMGAGIARGASLEGLRAIDVHPTIAALLSAEPGTPLDGHVYASALVH